MHFCITNADVANPIIQLTNLSLSSIKLSGIILSINILDEFDKLEETALSYAGFLYEKGYKLIKYTDEQQ